MTWAIVSFSPGAPNPAYVIPSRSFGLAMSSRSARTPIPVASCWSTAMTDLIGEPAARENVIDAWKLIPNSAAPVPTRMSGTSRCTAGSRRRSRLPRRSPGCWATYSPVWLVFGVQSRANRIVAASGALVPAGSDAAVVVPGAAVVPAAAVGPRRVRSVAAPESSSSSPPHARRAGRPRPSRRTPSSGTTFSWCPSPVRESRLISHLRRNPRLSTTGTESARDTGWSHAPFTPEKQISDLKRARVAT